MFGWLRKRLIKEHAKLVIQTDFALDVLVDGWFSEKPEIIEPLRRERKTLAQIIEGWDREGPLEPDHVEYLFSLNKELRRLHDSGPKLVGDGFDKAYEPLLGYSEAVERFLEK